MRWLLGVLVVAVAWMVACQQASRPGGMIATDDENLAAATFTISVPANVVRVPVGGSNQTEITLDRGDAFGEEVEVALELPPGMTANPASFSFVDRVDKQLVTLLAAADIQPDVYRIEVRATPTSGAATAAHFDVMVTD